MSKTKVDHIAIHSKNIKKSVKWYVDKFRCEIQYQDDTWALLNFENISLALVTPEQHPPHFAIIDERVASHKIKKFTEMEFLIYILMILILIQLKLSTGLLSE